MSKCKFICSIFSFKIKYMYCTCCGKCHRHTFRPARRFDPRRLRHARHYDPWDASTRKTARDISTWEGSASRFYLRDVSTFETVRPPGLKTLVTKVMCSNYAYGSCLNYPPSQIVYTIDICMAGWYTMSLVHSLDISP